MEKKKERDSRRKSPEDDQPRRAQGEAATEDARSDGSAEQDGRTGMPTGQLETIGEEDDEYGDESEESGYFDGFGDYDAWCAKLDGPVFDEDGYILGSERDEVSDGYSELGGYPSEEEAELGEELTAKNRRALAKECGEDERRAAALSFADIDREIDCDDSRLTRDMDDVRAQMRQEMSEAVRSARTQARARRSRLSA